MEWLSKYTSTEIAAWWGAILATLVLVWDFYKHSTSGAKLRLEVNSNMAMFGDPSREGMTFIAAKVTNVGGRDTTITNIGMTHFKNRFNQILNKPESQGIVPKPNSDFPLPYVLEPGKYWMGLINQEGKVEEMLKDGILFVWVSDAVGKKTIKKSVCWKDGRNTKEKEIEGDKKHGPRIMRVD